MATRRGRQIDIEVRIGDVQGETADTLRPDEVEALAVPLRPDGDAMSQDAGFHETPQLDAELC